MPKDNMPKRRNSPNLLPIKTIASSRETQSTTECTTPTKRELPTPTKRKSTTPTRKLLTSPSTSKKHSIMVRTEREIEIEKNKNLQNHYFQRQDLKLWPLLSKLHTDFLLQIETIMWYGWINEPVHWDTVLIITIDKSVYSLIDENNQLITSDLISTVRTKKIDGLCRKNIKSMIRTGGSSFVLTEEGKIYSWGFNINNICGNPLLNEHEIINISSVPAVSYPLEVIGLADKCVVDIKCGNSHVLVLTEDRKIYSWGTNDYGQVGATDNTILMPIEIIIEDESGKKDIQNISCGSTFSMAVTCDGKLYGWGENKYLGKYLTDSCAIIHPKPKEIIINEPIAKVECGYKHTLALTKEGSLYVWGKNDAGQLGTGHCEETYYPRLLNTIGKVTDIAARFDSRQSAAINEDKRIYKWGMYDECNRLANIDYINPTVVNLNNIHDAFINFQNVITMQNPCTSLAKIQEFLYVTSDTYLKNAFNSHTSADAELIVNQQFLYIHKNILMIRCPQLYTEFFMYNTNKIIIRDDFSAASYKIFLNYVYTGECTSDISDKILLELFDLATIFDHAIFRKKCTKIIKKTINIINVIYFYSEAILREIKDLEEFCFKYAINNLTAVVRTKNFAELSEKMQCDFIIKAADANAFKS